MHLGAIPFVLRARAKSASGRNDNGEAAADKAEPAGLRAIVDELNVGIVLLDSDRRVQFVNRAFRRFWRISDELAESRPSFVRLMYNGRGSTASAVSHYRLGDYVAKQLDLIRTGEERPLHIRLTNGLVIQFRCKALAGGGHVLTYGNVSELAQQAEALERLACVDAMTGVNNRRHFLVLAETEWSRFRRYGRPLALLMLDIDFFKSVNDRYGHDVGDDVIKAVAEALEKHRRASDIIGRLGGEEFALMLPEATLDNAVGAAERFRKLIAGQTIAAREHQLSITISVGASVATAEVSGVRELIKQADVALYEAKRSGRNRVCRFAPPEPTPQQQGESGG